MKDRRVVNWVRHKISERHKNLHFAVSFSNFSDIYADIRYFQTVKHSMFKVDITEMEGKTFPVTSSIPLIKMAVASQNSEVTANITTNRTLSAETEGQHVPCYPTHCT